jgi:hypothetical protein
MNLHYTLKPVIITILSLYSTCLFSQPGEIKRTNHWYFGENCGIDFSGGVAVADTRGALNTWEGCAAISDTRGSLLFYTDGKTVWDSTHPNAQWVWVAWR